MKKNDLILIITLLLLIFLAFGLLRIYQKRARVDTLYAVITQDEQVIERIDLNQVEESWEFILPGAYYEVIQVEKGRIRFKETDCPNQICVRAGWLSKPGDMAVCLPNKAIIRLDG